MHRFLLHDGQAAPITNRPSPCTGKHKINGDMYDITEFFISKYEGAEYRFWLGNPLPELLPEMVDKP